MGSVSRRVQPGGRSGPRGICGPAGHGAEWAGAVGVPGAWPSRLSLQLLKASSTTALFTGGHGPSGRLHYRQAGAAGRQGCTASKDPAVSLCGRPHPPPEGEVLASPLTAFPPRGGEAPPCPWGNSQAQPLLRDFRGQADVRRAGVSWSHKSGGKPRTGTGTCLRGLVPTRPFVGLRAGG